MIKYIIIYFLEKIKPDLIYLKGKPIIFLIKNILGNKSLFFEKRIALEREKTFHFFNSYKMYEESLVIGNGPSLNEFFKRNFNFAKNKTIYCVNGFILSEYFFDIKPIYYVFMDPDYWNNFIQEKCKNEINLIRNKMILIDWEMKIFLPEHALNWNWFIDIPFINKNIDIIYINSTIINSNDENVKFEKYKNNEALLGAQTVLVTALFLSLNMKHKINYLVGADLSLHETVCVNEQNVVCTKHVHFYDQNTEIKLVPFWKDSTEKETFKMYEIFYAFSKMFQEFSELEKYAIYLNSKVYNLTEKSYIDAFERCKIDDYYDKKKDI